METTRYPKVGVAVFVYDPHKPEQGLIWGQRKGSHGAGKRALPGGHLDWNEPSFESCAIREVKEETDLDVGNVVFLAATNDVMIEEDKHYITIFVKAEIVGGKRVPETMEPNKCLGWDWATWEELKKTSEAEKPEDVLFLPLINLLKQVPECGPVP